MSTSLLKLILLFTLLPISSFAQLNKHDPPYQLLWVELGALQCVEGGCTRYYVFSRPFPLIPEFKQIELDRETGRKVFTSIHYFKVELENGKVLNWKILLGKTVRENYSNYFIKAYYLLGDGDPETDGGIFVYGPSPDLNNIPRVCMETKIPFTMMGEKSDIDPYFLMFGDYHRKLGVIKEDKSLPRGGTCF